MQSCVFRERKNLTVSGLQTRVAKNSRMGVRACVRGVWHHLSSRCHRCLSNGVQRRHCYLRRSRYGPLDWLHWFAMIREIAKIKSRASSKVVGIHELFFLAPPKQRCRVISRGSKKRTHSVPAQSYLDTEHNKTYTVRSIGECVPHRGS